VQENPKAVDVTKEEAPKKESKVQSLDILESSQSMGKSMNAACESCGLFNNVTQDCHRMLCEICGFTSHNTYDYKDASPGIMVLNCVLLK